MRRLHAGLPADVILVLDAAYAEYVRRNDYESGIELAATMDNVVMTRTFSKIHGLAGLRIGWCYGPAHIVDALNRIRGPFNVSSPAIAAGVASLGDRGHMDRAAAHNEVWLPRVTEAVTRLGLKVTPSVGNFVLIHFPNEPGRSAADADAYLFNRGIVLRRIEAYGLPNALRMTIGTAEANEVTVAALAEFVGAQRQRDVRRGVIASDPAGFVFPGKEAIDRRDGRSGEGTHPPCFAWSPLPVPGRDAALDVPIPSQRTARHSLGAAGDPKPARGSPSRNCKCGRSAGAPFEGVRTGRWVTVLSEDMGNTFQVGGLGLRWVWACGRIRVWR